MFLKFFRQLNKDIRGQSLLETAIVFPVLLLLVVGSIQFALIFNAKQVVNYAAFCAARTGVVYSTLSEYSESEEEIKKKMKNAAALACSSIAQANSIPVGGSQKEDIDLEDIESLFKKNPILGIFLGLVEKGKPPGANLKKLPTKYRIAKANIEVEIIKEGDKKKENKDNNLTARVTYKNYKFLLPGLSKTLFGKSEISLSAHCTMWKGPKTKRKGKSEKEKEEKKGYYKEYYLEYAD